jgi:hypothetical protein
MLFRRTEGQLRAVRRLSSLAFLAVALAISAVLTIKFVHSSTGSISGTLSKISHNNTGQGAGFGSSNVPYSSDPLLFPRDVYTVLFDPLPITARSATQFIAAAENTIILGVFLGSLRRLRLLWHAARSKPFIMMCLVYSLAFCYAFAALGNLGLIERERTLLFPFLMVLMAFPLSPKDEPPKYAWEQRSPKRRNRVALGGPPPPGVTQA